MTNDDYDWPELMPEEWADQVITDWDDRTARRWRNPYTFPDAAEIRERDATNKRIGYDPRTGRHDRKRWRHIGNGAWTMKTRKRKHPKQLDLGLPAEPACTRTRHIFVSAELDVSTLELGGEDLRAATLAPDTRCDCGRYVWSEMDWSTSDLDVVQL